MKGKKLMTMRKKVKMEIRKNKMMKMILMMIQNDLINLISLNYSLNVIIKQIVYLILA